VAVRFDPTIRLALSLDNLMKINAYAIVAAFLWVSAVVFFMLGSTPANAVFRYGAMSDALGATVFTFIAVRKWVN